MKKYLIGFVAGAIVATAATAFADDIQSLIGREVQGEFKVTVQGKELEQKALVIDGTSYAPVRAIGEAVGNIVEFDMEKGITLTRKEEQKVSPTPTPTPVPTPTSKPATFDDITPDNATLEQARQKYQMLYSEVINLNAQIKLNAEGPEKEKAKADLPGKEAELERWSARIKALGGEVPK